MVLVTCCVLCVVSMWFTVEGTEGGKQLVRAETMADLFSHREVAIPPIAGPATVPQFCAPCRVPFFIVNVFTHESEKQETMHIYVVVLEI